VQLEWVECRWDNQNLLTGDRLAIAKIGFLLNFLKYFHSLFEIVLTEAGTRCAVSLLQKRPAGSQFTEIKSCSQVSEVKLKKSSPTAAPVKKKDMTKATTKVDSQKGTQKNLRSFFMPPAAKGKENTVDVNIVPQPSDSETSVKTSLVQGGSQHSTPSFLPDDTSASQISSSDTLPLSTSQAINEEPVDWSQSTSTTSELEKSSFETSTNLAAKAEWQRIQKTMKRVPLCSGHNEPCAVRVVKKPGPNLGRTFHCCARAQVRSPSSSDPLLHFTS